MPHMQHCYIKTMLRFGASRAQGLAVQAADVTRALPVPYHDCIDEITAAVRDAVLNEWIDGFIDDGYIYVTDKGLKDWKLNCGKSTGWSPVSAFGKNAYEKPENPVLHLT